MHPEARAFVSKVTSELPLRRRVVEIGGRNINGGVREFFPAAEYINTDIEEGKGVDVVADGAEYEPPWEPDTVVCCEVLEHAEQAEAIIANAHRMLRPGGLLILTAAAPPREVHSGWDGGPHLFKDEFYRNVEPDELARWLSIFGARVKVEYDSEHGDIYAVAVKEPTPAPAKPFLDWVEV